MRKSTATANPIHPAAAPKPCLSGAPALPVKGSRVSEENIRLRAYKKWESAGKPAGDDVTFWQEAEQELLQPK